MISVACIRTEWGMVRPNVWVDFQGDQVGRELGQPIVAVFREAVLDEDVLALRITVLAQPLKEALDQERSALARAGPQEADSRHPGRLHGTVAKQAAASRDAETCDAEEDATPALSASQRDETVHGSSFGVHLSAQDTRTPT
jgi:hypothetical protein